MPVLLGGHVVRSADAGACQVHLLVKHLGNTEITELDTVISDEDVRRLEVAMQDAFVVHVEDGKGNLGGPVYHLRLFEFSPAMSLLLINDQLVEVTAGAELHDDVKLLSVDDGLAVRYDVNVLERL